MSGFWDDAEVISEYSRRQAIEDGTLVPLEGDLGALALEAGFRCDVALTRPLFVLVDPTDRERAAGQSITGRLWDVLHMARVYSQPARMRAADDEAVDASFPCIFFVAGRPGLSTRPARSLQRLWFHLGPGDDGEPVVTIGFPGDR